MSEMIKLVSDASFEQDVVESDKPVLVEFWAPWCGPCKTMAPILEKVAQGYADKLDASRIDIDDNQATSAKLRVRSIPTLILFKNGAEAARKVVSFPRRS